MKKPADPARRRLRCLVKSAVWSLLARLAGPAGADGLRLTVRAADGVHEVVAVVRPAGEAAEPAPGESFPGSFFSPIEAAVWHALAAGPTPAKRLARLVGQNYSPTFRTILFNLTQRGVLRRETAGLRRAAKMEKP